MATRDFVGIPIKEKVGKHLATIGISIPICRKLGKINGPWHRKEGGNIELDLDVRQGVEEILYNLPREGLGAKLRSKQHLILQADSGKGNLSLMTNGKHLGFLRLRRDGLLPRLQWFAFGRIMVFIVLLKFCIRNGHPQWQRLSCSLEG
jgi:hypothetical protein